MALTDRVFAITGKVRSNHTRLATHWMQFISLTDYIAHDKEVRDGSAAISGVAQRALKGKLESASNAGWFARSRVELPDEKTAV